MLELDGNDRSAAQELIDEMMRTAAVDALAPEARRFAPVRTQHGQPPQRLELEACVRFSGTGGCGVVALACRSEVAAELMGEAEPSQIAWVMGRVAALGRRIQKRLRQFGIAVAFDAPEALSERGLVYAPELPSFRTTYLFGPRDGDLLVHLDGELDIARIASTGEVPLRDEGDIILF